MVLFLCGAQLHAQAAATVPATSGIYDRLESVSALFPVRGVFLGERPLSRRELRRVTARLASAIETAPTYVTAARRDWARVELAAIARELDGDSGGHPTASVTARASLRGDVFTSDALSERINSNGMGGIDAITHPFAPLRDGWPAGQGTVATLAPTGLLGVSDRLAFVAEPRFAVGHFRDGARAEDVFLHRAYVRGIIHNVALQLGADERRWGQSAFSTLFISEHAAPLPALAVGNDTAITLPWLFRLAGPVRGTLFLSDLGPSQDPPHAKLAGWQVSMAPWSRFELGVSVLAQTAGNDCQSHGTCASVFRRIVDLVPIIDALAPQHADLQISNKLAGGNLRLRFPELSGLDLLYELQMDDFDGRRLRSSFVDDAGHLLGARLPLHVANGQLTWRAEWHRTSLRLYEHGQYRSGVTYRQRIIGDPLGPNAKAGYMSVAWQRSPLSSMELRVADERRDPSHYLVLSSGPRDRGFTFVKDSVRPDYRRQWATVSVERTPRIGALKLTLGYNRAWRSGQAARNEWLGSVSLMTRRLCAF